MKLMKQARASRNTTLNKQVVHSSGHSPKKALTKHQREQTRACSDNDDHDDDDDASPKYTEA